MGGIYIKGMKMPKSGQIVLVEIDENGDVFAAYDGGRTKLTQHKATPVPPHGRLGDLDELHKEAVRRSEKAGTYFECKFMRNRTDLEPCEHCTNTFAMTGVHPSFTLKKTPITNYERLIRKTPEELAELLWDVWRHKAPFYKECVDGWAVPFYHWLKQEADR